MLCNQLSESIYKSFKTWNRRL